MTKVAVFVNHTDVSEYLITNVLKGRHVTRLKAPDKPGKYAQQIEKTYFEHGISEFVFPMYWESLTTSNIGLNNDVAKLVTHLPVKLTAPLANTPLEEIITKLKTRKNFAGACEHWQADAPTESCGMCVPCFHKYLILKKLCRPTEDIFLEDPITGYDGKVRFYNLLTKMSDPKYAITRLEVSLAALISDCFIKDVFPIDVSDVMEKRFKKFLEAWGSGE